MDKYTGMFKADLFTAGEALSSLVKFGVVKDVELIDKVSIRLDNGFFFSVFEGTKRRPRRYSDGYEEVYVEFDAFEVFCVVKSSDVVKSDEESE